MSRSIFVAVALALVLAAPTAHGKPASNYTSSALGDEITNLPGAPPVTFKMFSGFIDVSASGEAPGTRKMFYWFAEAEDVDPTNAPLLLWTNGGPGCSGFNGLMTEQGPFRVNKDMTLSKNPYAWNKIANVVFIEQPVGVGFSTTTKADIDYGDAQAATDNLAFVKGFLAHFNNFATNDFYITSESYGGHYMPTLAAAIVDNGGVPSFKGVFLGNPLTYMPYRNYGEIGTFHGHQLLPRPLWDAYEDASCRTSFPPSEKCQQLTQQAEMLTQGEDAYALDFPVCNSSGNLAAGRHERHHLLTKIKQAGSTLGGYFPDTYEPCDSDYMTSYFNTEAVQTAIGAIGSGGSAVTWSGCSDHVGQNYNTTDVNLPMMPVWKKLVAVTPALKLMIYSGDDDSVCATMGTQQFIWDLGLDIVSKWQPWMTPYGQVAGYHTQFQGLAFATVHGAGHMVPATRPAQSLQLLAKFLQD